MKHASFVLALVLSAGVASSAEPTEEALRLRNLGLAQLENEQPALAEDVFTELEKLMPSDPLSAANLAIATLRQQDFAASQEWMDKALAKAPDDPRLIAIQGDVHQWSGRLEAAFDAYRKAADMAPEDVELQYSLYRQATTYSPEGGEQAAAVALRRLAKLRPENLVIILQAGQKAIQSGDRTAATDAFLRIRELLWQAPDVAAKMLDQVLEALEKNDLAAARVPALRLENVLKITPMYREGLRELNTGIQGVPVIRFRNEPAATNLGDPVEVTFQGSPIATGQLAGAAMTVGDFDRDQRSDVAWVTRGAKGRLSVRAAKDLEGEPSFTASLPSTGEVSGLLSVDLDNDGQLDLVAYGPEGTWVWRGLSEGRFESSDIFGLAQAGALAAAAIDFDIEGDLDLALVGGRSGPGELYRNSLSGPLEAVGNRVLPVLKIETPQSLVASDLDRDGDVDLVVGHAGGLTWLDNLRQGRFADRTDDAGLREAPAAKALVSADFDNDGWPDLAVAGDGLAFLHNLGGRFEPWALGDVLKAPAQFSTLVAFDADNDGRTDLAVGGPAGVAVLAQRPGPRFQFVQVRDAPAQVSRLEAADLDGDGDLDLLVAGDEGLHWLENQGGNQNHWLSVRLQGLEKGNSKNNFFGIGATVEIRAGQAYHFQEVTSDRTHLGIGRIPRADLLRVVWTNGVPQNRLDPEPNQRIVEEQVLKGSCPFLYTSTGDRTEFVTDLLWGAPIGMPVAPGVWATADPQELVEVRGAEPEDGIYRLEITEELWEAAFFDYLRLWVVDSPSGVEVASSLRIVPGRSLDDKVLGTRDLQPVRRAWDAAGRDVTDVVRLRDDVYADGWTASRYQGVTSEPWTFMLDLGEAPGREIRLHLDGWVFPADASLNLAVAQRSDLRVQSTRLEVETASGWQALVDPMGFPAGKTKTMVVDTPPLPEGASRLRITSNRWLSWDRISWSTQAADDAVRIRAQLSPVLADLHYRGFSAVHRVAPNGPHSFDYSVVRAESPWLPLEGRFTRYGDVRELLGSPDDRSVILGPGDEMSLQFDASSLPPVPEEWERSVFLESHGWDKDADRNTWAGDRVEPLPFRTMSGYPYSPGERFPDSPLLRAYREQWLTRVVGSQSSDAAP